MVALAAASRLVLIAAEPPQAGSAKADPATTRQVDALPHPVPGKGYTNSLGMRFVPVPGTQVCFSIWETRMSDYAEYAGKDREIDSTWRNVKQLDIPAGDEPNYPVIKISWEEAQAFCKWLTEKEHAEGRLIAEQRYRLPTDLEWSAAVGLTDETGATPRERERANKAMDRFPWGNQWPPPKGAGNFADTTVKAVWPGMPQIAGYQDNYATTAPVGSFAANELGLYDLAGNVNEWCEDWFDLTQTGHAFRGGSWLEGDRLNLLSAFRGYGKPGHRYNNVGFRCVLTVEQKPAPVRSSSP